MQKRTCCRCGAAIRGRRPRTPIDYCTTCRPRSGHHATCGVCGIPTTDGNRFCSDGCREHHSWERRKPPLEIADCKQCGTAYVCKRPIGRTAYCSAQCKVEADRDRERQRYHADTARSRARSYHAYRRRKLTQAVATLASWEPVPSLPLLPPGPTAYGQCPQCGDDVQKGRRYCTPQCSAAAKMERDRERSRKVIAAHRKRWIGANCGECGQPFIYYGDASHRYCCTAHAKRNRRRRDKTQRSKRIQTGVAREVIDLPTLAMRDGWRCHICKRKVTRKTWSHDHLIPLSAGGSHTYDNVALAHFLCNSARQAGGDVQLRLAA